MANSVCDVLLTERPLAIPTEPFASEIGAVVDFWGVVRATENGGRISGIEYETNSAMAEHQLSVLGHEAIDRFGLAKITIHHRFGFVPVGEPSLIIRVASAHRAEAFRGAQLVVDELKKRVPIWKHPQSIAVRAESVVEARDTVQRTRVAE